MSILIESSTEGDMKILLLFLILQQAFALDCGKTFQNDSGILDSPPISAHQSVCSFSILPLMSSTVLLNFTEINFPEKDDVLGQCSEVLAIKVEGPNNTKPEPTCGKQKGLTKYLTSRNITITLKRKLDGHSFFKAKYKVCSFEFNDKTGVMSAESFRPGATYRLLTCLYRVRQSSPIILHINRTNIFNAANCDGYIMINMTERLLLQKSSLDQMHTETETYYFQTGLLDIILNVTCNLKGQFASYHLESPGDFTNDLRGRKGSFRPHLFYQKYANNAKYQFTISSDHGGKLILLFDDVDFGPNCSDVVIIQSKGNSDSTRLCRENITAHAVTTTTDKASVYFITDFKESGKGFQGFWTTCGGRLTDSTGEIWSPRHGLPSPNVTYDAECDYTVHVAGAERIFIVIQSWNLPPDNLKVQDNITGNGTYAVNGDTLSVKYKSAPNDYFQAVYIACPMILTNQSGQLEIGETLLQAIAPGYNCTFEVQNGEGNIVSVNPLFDTGTENKTNECIGDFLHIKYYNRLRELESSVTCGSESDMLTYRSWGPISVIYASVNHENLQFKAVYKITKDTDGDDLEYPNSGPSVQGTSGFWKNFTKSELFIPVLAGSAGLILLIFITVAVVNYRRKRKNAAQDFVWLSDKATSTLDKSFVPFLPDADDTDDCYQKKGEIIIGLGGYAEVVFPNASKDSQEVPSVIEDRRRSEVSTFSLHRSRADSTIPVYTVTENAGKNDVINRIEYSTPWDAKNERDKIVKVMSLKCPSDRKPSAKEVFQGFPYESRPDESFGIPCTDETIGERNNVDANVTQFSGQEDECFRD